METSVLVQKYRRFLPITSKTPPLTIGEGDTPLKRSEALERMLNSSDVEVHLKMENENHPTYSFKDRGMFLAVAKAVEEGKKIALCASTGNTSASAAAYAQVAGLACAVVVSQTAAQGKLVQAEMYGAHVLKIPGDFDVALKVVRYVDEKYPEIALVNSVNPYRIEGQKTAAFEICDVLGEAPDYLFIPVGNAGNITAYWKGFKEYAKAKRIGELPKMMGYQAKGADPIVQGKIIEHPETIASAIKIGNPANWKYAVAARTESGGIIASVTDQEILSAQFLLSAKIGKAVFVEPASATSVAGLLDYDQKVGFPKGSKIVCVLTGAGVKDPTAALSNATNKNPIKEAEVGELESLISGLIPGKVFAL